MRQNENKIRFIGITGGIGAGKTEILKYIKRHYKCEIHLADEVAHGIMEPEGACYEGLVALLGKDVLSPDGKIERNRMAAKIFTNTSLLYRINRIVHPAVGEYLVSSFERAKKEGQTELFFIEAALLIEAGYKDMVDELWYIYAPSEIREHRLQKNRGYSREKISGIMASQLKEDRFRKECDFVIDNSTTLEEAYRQIDERLEGYTWLD